MRVLKRKIHNFALCIVIFFANQRIDLYIFNYLVSVSERAKGRPMRSTAPRMRKSAGRGSVMSSMLAAAGART